MAPDKVFSKEGGNKLFEKVEMIVEKITTFDYVLRKDILFPIYPKMVESFLGTVQNFNKVTQL